jgi:hypothetical protein
MGPKSSKRRVTGLSRQNGGLYVSRRNVDLQVVIKDDHDRLNELKFLCRSSQITQIIIFNFILCYLDKNSASVMNFSCDVCKKHLTHRPDIKQVANTCTLILKRIKQGRSSI